MHEHPAIFTPKPGALSIALIFGRNSGGAGVASLTITLNGERFELADPITVAELLTQLAIDARRVAVEHNLVVLKRVAFEQTLVGEGDEVEIVNFVGGG